MEVLWDFAYIIKLDHHTNSVKKLLRTKECSHPLAKTPLSNAGDTVSIPGWGTEIPHASMEPTKTTKKRYGGLKGKERRRNWLVEISL